MKVPSTQAGLPTLAIVLPCYNEEEVLPSTSERMLGLLRGLISDGLVGTESRLLFVDDGSTDSTWELIRQLASSNHGIAGLKLSRNFGHQNALLAAMLTADADAIVTMDVDLQDDPAAIAEMLLEFHAGRDIVFGVRCSRETDTVFKRATARAFYRLMRLMGVPLVEDHADFRLLSRRALVWLSEFGETDVFLRGLVPMLSANVATVKYERCARAAGVSKYPLRKMLAFAWRGIVSCTPAPLRLVTLAGFSLSVVSVSLALWALVTKFTNPSAVPGWASIVVPSYLLGGLQILCLGVVGEYLNKLFIETKARPRFLVEQTVGNIAPELREGAPQRRAARAYQYFGR